MIVLKYSYDTSICASYYPTFNNGYVCTKTEVSGGGSIKVVTYESDTVFTTISFPRTTSAPRSCITKVDWIDLTNFTGIAQILYEASNMTSVTFANATSKLKDVNHACYNCSSLIEVNFIDCDLSSVNSTQNIFNGGCSGVIQKATYKNVKFGDGSRGLINALRNAPTMIIENINTDALTSCSQMFNECIGLVGVLDLSYCNFTNILSFDSMFNNCTNLVEIIMPKGRYEKATNMNYMFANCTSLKKVVLDDFITPNVTSFYGMFGGCRIIEEIDLSSLGAYKANNMTNMFIDCFNLKKLNMSGIGTIGDHSMSHFTYNNTGICPVEWLDMSNIKHIPRDTQNMWKIGDHIRNIGMLYCPAEVIKSHLSQMRIPSTLDGYKINIYYHDANPNELTQDDRFNYIYCEEYHGDVVTTPDDLELYGLSDVQDTLDLTTGTYTQRVKKWNLAEEGYTFLRVVTNQEAQGYVRFDFRQPQLGSSGNPTCILNKATHINNLGLPNLTEKVCVNNLGRCLGVAANNAFLMLKLKTTDVTSYDKTGLDEWVQANDFTIYYNAVFSSISSSIKTETYQVNINPLKSYRNGSITTSSQQLTPTLKTTLPISNKFTTTNLTSGSTYNVYFDGTATKLDAGGTIITSPVSPCEVECGGTSLTIEGTDIQNVRVIETTIKNEVGSVCGKTDVELSKVITSDLEVITNDIEFNAGTMTNGNVYEIDNELGTINTKGGHSWGAGSFTSNKTYPKGFSLLHVEFDVDMPSDNLMAIINFNNNVGNTYYNFRDLTLDNDTATIAQGQTSGTGVKYSSIVTKGHFSRLVYCFSSQGTIKLDINTGSSGMITSSGNSAEGSTSGYTACASNGITISNFKIKVIENYPDTTNSSQITSSLRTDDGLTVIWQDMDMSIGQSISTLEQPIKLRSLGTTYDSYNPVSGELTKRIGVSETDGSYSVLSSPIVTKIVDSKLYRNIFDVNGEVKNWNSTPTVNGNEMTFTGTYFTAVRVPKLIIGKTYTLFYEFVTGGRIIVLSDYTNQNSVITGTDTGGTWLSAGSKGVKTFMHTGVSGNGAVLFYANSSGTTYKNIMIVEGTFDNYEELPYFENEVVITYDNIKDNIPHLYTNGQVKVYSDSEVYPTTILNGQSTNNYEINELNKSNNYTIRYDGTCESINLNGKSNEQGTNRIVKTSTNGSGNLTFVNDNGDIDNVLLVQNDVREQEINHFTGLQTVEVSRMLIENQRNMWWNDWITPSEYGASWQVDSPEFISVQPGETIYVVANNNSYTSLFEFDENYNIVNQGKDLILSNEANPKPIDLGNGYYKNYRVLSENTRYIKFTIPAGTASTAKSETRWSIISFTRADIGNVPLYTNDTPYRGSIINLPQPVQLNSLPDGTCDTYNPITGEYVQNVGYFVLDDTFASSWKIVKTKDGKPIAQRDLSTQEPNYSTLVKDYSFPNALYDYQTGKKAIANIPLVYSIDHTSLNVVTPSLYGDTYFENHFIRIALPFTPNDLDQWNYSYTQVNDWLRENPIHIVYKRTEPITTQLTPINIPTFEGGTLQLVTTDGKVFPMIEYSMPTNNRYDTSSWEAGAVYTQRNMTEVYFNDSTTPMTPTETTTLTTDHISSGSIILNDNGNGLIVLKGNYTGRDIPYFTGMRSVEAIEVETTPSPDQPIFGKGGRK